MIQEVWKDIKGYEGLYQISNLGRVKTLNRICKIHRKATREIKEIILTTKFLPKGYCFIALYKNNKETKFYIHRLVATAFIPNIDNKPQVNHKDGNKNNNVVSNLEWVTPSENLIHALKTKLKIPKKGIDNHRYGKTGRFTSNSKIVIDLETGIYYESAVEAANANNVKYPTMASWLHGRGSGCKRFIHA